MNVYGRKRGRVGVKQYMHSFHYCRCLLGISFYAYMSKRSYVLLFNKNFCPSKYRVFPPNILLIIRMYFECSVSIKRFSAVLVAFFKVGCFHANVLNAN